MSQAMQIKAVAPWFGSKRTLAPIIAKELGKHTHFLDPMCGSLAVLFGKPKSRMETVNDLHGDVINLARVIQDDQLCPVFFEQLQWTLVHEDTLAECRARTVEMPELPEGPGDITRALDFFVVSWIGRNGESGLAKQERSSRIAVRWTANGGDPATRFRNAVDSIPAWWRRLSGVTILRRDAFEIIERLPDDEGVALYCDPPYVHKSDSYLHDFTNHGGGLIPDDHQRLADGLRRFKKARVVVSYYDCPRVRELYEGWTVVEHTRQKHLAAQQGRGPRKESAPEVLVLNGPSYAGGTP